MTMTTYDEELCKKIEPGVSTTKERFEVLKQLRDAGIPTVVWLCRFYHLSTILKKTSPAFWSTVRKRKSTVLSVSVWV